MATLYTEQDSNVRKTWLLITVFFLFIIAIGWFLSQWFGSPAILLFAVVWSVVTSIGSYWWSDKLVIAISHARPLEKQEAPELYRVVENLSITAGLPMPRIYILNEDAPNAFATGRNPKHAVVAVTRGLLETLDRTELEGVLAHELSHIGNRDILVSTVVVVLAGVVVLAVDIAFRSMLWGGFNRRDSKDSGGLGAIFLVVGFVAMLLAPLLATLLRLAVSRKREFLADASGALLTRYPDGLIRALEKIAQSPYRLSVANNATAHLYFENPFGADDSHAQNGKREGASWFTKLFMTHPPIEDRIKALRHMQ